MTKCHGCGASKQTEDINKEGYARSIQNELCERCFRIKHYNDYKKVEKSNADFMPIMNSIATTKDLVVLLVDLLNIPEELDKLIGSFKNPILLVLTKRDLLPASLYEERIMDYFESNKVVDIIVVSSANNYQLDELMGCIRTYQTSNTVYIVGYTNAGKSTLINKILYNYTDKLPVITTSILPSTTIEKISIEVDSDLTLVDTPGLLEDGNIIQVVDEKQLKYIVPKKEIKPITFQMREKQFILIDEFARLDFEKANNVTLYMSNDLEIKRVWKEPENIGFEKHEVVVHGTCDIVISGLGFIKVMDKDIVTVYTLPGVKVYTRISLI